MIQRAKNVVFGHFLEFRASERLQLALITLNDLYMWAVMMPVPDHSKIIKIPFWMIQYTKMWGFDHFLEFDLSDRLQIAYFDYNK